MKATLATQAVATTAMLVLLLALVLPLQAADQMTRLFAQPGSTVSIKGSNNYHHWEIQGDVIDGFAEFGGSFPIETGQKVKLWEMPAHMGLHSRSFAAPWDKRVDGWGDVLHTEIHGELDIIEFIMNPNQMNTSITSL